jgi:hypothetical protein
MTGAMNNALGERGEAIFKSIMLNFHGKLPLFRVQFLGDKWPTVDFICELEGAWKNSRPFCLVQVKTTRSGYTKRDGRLKVAVKLNDALLLRGFKVPTYVVGIDEVDERAFIVAAMGRKKTRLPSLHAAHELTDPAGRRALWTEVRDFWKSTRRQTNWSALAEPRWL